METKKVLIIDADNTRLSQMAEGWIRYYSKDKAEVFSAGIKTGKLDMIAAKAMMEAVIDITHYKPENLETFSDMDFSHVILINLQQQKVSLPLNANVTEWTITDPNDTKKPEMDQLKDTRKLVNQMEDLSLQFVIEKLQLLSDLF